MRARRRGRLGIVGKVGGGLLVEHISNRDWGVAGAATEAKRVECGIEAGPAAGCLGVGQREGVVAVPAEAEGAAAEERALGVEGRHGDGKAAMHACGGRALLGRKMAAVAVAVGEDDAAYSSAAEGVGGQGRAGGGIMAGCAVRTRAELS